MIGHIVGIAGGMGYRAILLCGDPLLYARYGFEQAGKYGIRASDGKSSPALQVYALNKADITEYSGCYFESLAYDIDVTQAEEFELGFPTREKLADTPSWLRFRELPAMLED